MLPSRSSMTVWTKLFDRPSASVDAVVVLDDRMDEGVARKPVAMNSRHTAAGQPAQPLLGSNPYVVVPILDHRGHKIARQALRGRQRLEPASMAARETAAARSDPE